MILVRRRRRERAVAFGLKRISWIAARTRVRVASETCRVRALFPLSTLETVIGLTPTRAATSLIVTSLRSDIFPRCVVKQRLSGLDPKETADRNVLVVLRDV